MEIEVKQRNQRNRRRERAQRMQAQRESKVKDGDSGEDESPAREKPPRPAARRKKSREPLGEEEIIDGFAIMAFRTYEDLEAAVKCASSPRTNSLSTKPRLPLATLTGDAARNHPPNNVNSHGITLLQDAGTSDDSGRASERLTGSSVAPRDPDSSRDRLSDASSRCSSGKGYICDSEGEDDKASPDNSRNASPRYHDASMEDVSDGSALFRVTGAGGGKNELVARGGSGGALALSRAPVGGSASPAPAPLPQPAPSPAPAALPPPALPPPTFRADTPSRSNGAHIPSLDGHAATQIPARPGGVGPDTPERPAGTKLQPGARATADSPTPAPPAPSPLFPSHPAYQHAALPDYRHTNHETRTKPPEPPQPRPPAPTLHPPTPTSFPNHAAALPPAPHPAPHVPAAPTSLPSQTSPATQTSRPYPQPSIGSSHINSSLSSSIHGHSTPYQSQASVQKHSVVPPVYANRPPHLAPFSIANHINHLPSSTASQPAAAHLSHPVNSHSIVNHHIPHSASPLATSTPNHMVPPNVALSTSPPTIPSFTSTVKHPGLSLPPHSHPNSHPSLPATVSSIHQPVMPNHSEPLPPPSTGAPTVVSAVPSTNNHPAPPVIDSRQVTSSANDLPSRTELPARTESASVTTVASTGYPPPAAYPGGTYPPLYAPYATTLQHSPYLPPAAASPRNSADTRTSLSASPLVAPKTPKGVRPHTPGSGAGAGPISFSPRHSPGIQRDGYSSISSLSRASVTTPVSSSAATGVSGVSASSGAGVPPSMPPAPAPLPAPPPLASSLGPPLSVASLTSHITAPPLPAPLAAPIAAPLAAPLPTPLSAPLPAPLTAPLPTPLTAPLAAPTPTPAAPASTHLTHTLAPVPTVGSISSSSKPPAHWGVTRSTVDRPAGFPPAPLFGAPLAPPNPNPFSADSLFQSSPGADLLRRELDNRFLQAAGGFSVRTEMHHHQHQHTHVHQHPHGPGAPHPAPHPPPHPHQLYVPPPHAPLFKDMGKMTSLYRTGIGLGYPYSSSLLHPTAPYVPPTLSSYAPKPIGPVVSAAGDVKPGPRPQVKTGKWNAMHVRIAWEIYNHQQKEKAGGGGGLDKDKLRGFPPQAAPPAPLAPQPPQPYRSPYDALPPPSPYLPPHHPHLGVSPFARYGASSFPGAPPPFALSPYARDFALSTSLHGVHHPPSLAALHEAWRAGAGPGVRPPPSAVAAAAAVDARREHEERARREREERERERERREREERERRKQREREMERARQRSPLRNGVLEQPKEERKEAPRPPPSLPPYPPPPAAWDPYRAAFDPLHHMRFTPLVEAAIRAEEDRAKMLSAYAHHQQLKTSGMLRGGLPPLPAPLPPLQLPHAPLDLLKKEEPR